MKTKHAFFAYPTSARASAWGCAKTGCYGVEISDWRQPVTRAKFFGPFDTVQEAETFAAGRPEPWHAAYERHPLPGSRFEVSAYATEQLDKASQHAISILALEQMDADATHHGNARLIRLRVAFGRMQCRDAAAVMRRA